MARVMVFAGTTEGRRLAETAAGLRLETDVYVVSEYGKDVLPDSPWLTVETGAIDQSGMEAAIKKEPVLAVFDATHPYASQASVNIRAACEHTGARYFRVLREQAGLPGGAVWYASSAVEAASMLKDTKGNILITTGSKELSAFTVLDGYKERVYARVLPVAGVLSACEELGIKGKHVIAMQGPFTREMNSALIRQFSIEYLVTKESGEAGGYTDKLEAARNCGVTVLVIRRPVKEEGISLQQAEEILAGFAAEPIVSYDRSNSVKKKISLVGIGMGTAGQLTLAAAGEIKACEVLFGAPRMLRVTERLGIQALLVEEYLTGKILAWLKEHPQYKRIGVLYSGDTGFYSGAKGFVEEAGADPNLAGCEITVYPGISTLSYFCARLKTGWEDIRPISLHGREWDLEAELRAHKRIFLLLGGNWSVAELCGFLISRGYGSIRVTVGEDLSYPEERIVQGKPEELQGLSFSGICAALLEQTEQERTEKHEG